MKKFYAFTLILFCIMMSYQSVAQFVVHKAELSPSRDIDDAKFTVTATPMDDDTWCRVEWPGNYNFDEYSYDDGEADDYFIYSDAGSINVDKFTPWSYPAEVTGGKIYVGNASFPGPFLGTQFRAMIFDDDGPNGLPGTALDSMDVTVENYYWVEFNGMSAIIYSGSFYLGMKQLAPSPDAAPIGVDTDNPTYFKSYSYFQDVPGWVLSPLQDFMIRAWLTNGNNNGDVDYWRIDRFSNFDPHGSPLLGDTTFLADVTNPYFNDFDWDALPMGWFAYGIKEHYLDGGWSDYSLSNLAGHITSFTVTLNIILCDTIQWEHTVVKVNGEEVPAELNPWGAYVTLEINSPDGAHLDIAVYCPGNDYYQLNNLFITHDKVYNILLSCTMYPVSNLTVDPVSLVATWDPPRVDILKENFEAGTFPPPGWQMQSQGNGWFRSENGSGGGWTIPAWDSEYACTNDLLTGENDGSQDYLITPELRLDYRYDNYLSFQNYFDGLNGQIARIEFSFDGEEWNLLYEPDPSSNWEDIELDLSPISDPEYPPIRFAFHADDNGQVGSGWAVDNISVYSPEPPYTLDGYWVYIDDSLFAVTDSNFIDLSPLTYGESYTIKVKAHYPSGLSSPITDTVFCEYLYPPSCFYQENDMLLIACPPLDTNGNIPQNLLGLNLYRDMEFVGYYSFDPEPPPYPIEIYIDDQPGIYNYSLSAVYDLTPYGYPGETGESGYLTTQVVVSWGNPLPFLEQWNDGTFETNNWLTDSENWSINWQEGQAAPSAQFTWDPVQQNYESALESYPFLADSLTEGNIFLDYDIKLDSYQPTGTEQMLVQVWNWDTQVWTTVSSYSNAEGSFSWTSEHIDITDQALGNVFKIRFLATGENSLNIIGWYLDNIWIYRGCNPPRSLDLSWTWYQQDFELSWLPPVGTVPETHWINWDDGIFSGNSIGTGDAVEFDAAARWTPEELEDFYNGKITEISFVPNEAQAEYRIRVWMGEFAQNLLLDQQVESPLIGEWNNITLNVPIEIYNNQELWVGYHVNTSTGYPAGVDDGPAVDGYGNMMNFGGWMTLLQINPDLDYNWNIKAKIQTMAIADSVSKYAIYRMDEWNEYFLRGYSDTTFFYDDSAICENTFVHCYQVTAIYESYLDYCESVPSNEVCEVCEKLSENQIDTDLKIYPNPASDVVFIESAEEVESVRVFDSRGEEVKRRRGEEGKGRNGDMETWRIPVVGLAPGLYLVRVETGKEFISRKIIIR
jgi:hypothetical protein